MGYTKINSFRQNSLIVNIVYCLAKDIVATGTFIYLFIFIYLSVVDKTMNLPDCHGNFL